MSSLKANDIFLNDRMARDAEDYDGSGGHTSAVSEQEERKLRFRAVRVYVIFILFTVILIGITTYQMAADLRMKHKANRIECVYTEGYYSAEGRDESGNTISFKFDEFAERSNGIITMYYYDNIRDARPMTSIWFYVIMYIVWLLFLTGFAALLWKRCHKSRHSVEYAGKSRFDD